jgi:hypothetical protein
MDHSLANRAFEYAELEEKVRDGRRLLAVAERKVEFERRALADAETECAEARVRLIAATEAER